MLEIVQKLKVCLLDLSMDVQMMVLGDQELQNTTRKIREYFTL